MSYSSDYFNAINKRKKKEEEKKSQSVDKSSNKSSNKSYASEYFEAMQSLESPLDTFMNDIAPVKKQTEQKKQKWYEGWLDKGAFDDGYQFGDYTKTVVSSAADLKTNFGGGVLEIGEGLVDSLAYLGGVGAKMAGQNKIAEGVKDFVKEDLYDGKKIASYVLAPEQYALKAVGEDIEDNSIWGDKTDSLAQSAGQLAGTIGLQSVGVPWWVTTGVTSFGGGVEQAFNEGANYAQAGLSSAISAGAEILSEKLFGGSGLGEKGLINVDKLTQGISNKVIKSLVDYGIDVAAEGSEEIVSGVMSNLGTALYKEDNIKDILFSEEAVDEYVQGFIGGAFLGGVMNAGNVKKSVQQKTDYRNGLTANEQKVFNKAYNDAITEAEKSGKKLTGKEKSKIRDNVMENLQKGYISTDTIEGVLGGETFGKYKSLTEQEKALTDEISQLENLPESQITVKQRERLLKAREELDNLADKTELKTRLTDGVRNQINAESKNLTERGSFLDESYKEIERRKQSFEADLTQYNGKQREAVERAVKSGVLNNTNRSHELVNVLSKIEADKGIVFNYADNAKLKETGFAIDGKTVNGFTKDGAVTLNVQSPKAWQSVVGHEVTHILEGTEAYSELQKSLFAYAESKGELESRKSALTELYKNVDADIDAELTADLVGDYLFSDNDFIKHLTSNRNVFEKVYDEIKYLFKVATGKEKADIEKVKRQFDKVWEEFKAEDIAENDNIKFSIRKEAPPKETGIAYKVFYVKDGKLYPPMVANPDGADTPIGVWLNADVGVAAPPSKTGRAQVKAGGKGTQGGSGSLAFRPGWHLGDLPRASQFDRVNPETGKKELFPENFVWAEVEYAKDVDYQEEAMSYGYTDNGKFRHAYAGLPRLPENGYYRYRTNPKPDTVPWVITGAMKVNRLLSDAEVNSILEKNGVPPVHRQGGDVGLDKFGFNESGKVKYSVSADSDGVQLSKEQREYFKDSKVTDDNGNLLVLYHGSPKGSTTIFDKSKTSKDNDMGQGIYFSTDKVDASDYLGKSRNNKLYTAYVNIKNPFVVSENVKISLNEVVELLKLCDDRIIASDVYNDLKVNAKDGYVTTDQFANTNISIYMTDILEKSKKYDGIVDETVTDKFGLKEGTKHIVALYSNQIKETTNTNPTADADIRYSLSKDSNGNDLSLAVQKRFANSKAVDENGNLKVLYHGTAADEFYTFDKSKGSVEGDFGSGFYFTDNESDVENNYEGGGADFENKVARRAEQIESEEDIDYDEAEARARKELYVGSNKFEVYLNIENPAIVGETNLLSPDSYYEEYDPNDYDSEIDYEGDVEQLIADDIDKIIWEVERNVDVDNTDGLAEVLWEAVNEGGIGIEQLKSKINNLYLEDSNGNLVGNEVTRQIIESLGYDGIIDNTVSSKFNMNLEEGTTHYIVFKPNQIKSISNQNPTDNSDIRYSISEVIDQNKTLYGVGVHLDSTLLDNLSPKERVEIVKEYVKELGGEVFTAYDNNGNATDITIAKSNKRFKNQNGKRTPVNKNLTTKYIGNETKQEAIALVDELIVSAKYSESKPPAYSHGWLDNNGNNDWEYWKTYIQDKNNTIWEATLNVANAADGEKILYDIYPIKKVGQSVKSDPIPTDSSISPIQENVKKSISKQGEQPSSVGTPLKDLYYGDDIAPVKETQSTTDTQFTDNIAPVTEDEADELYKQWIDSLAEAEAPPETDTEYYNTPDTTSLDDKALENIGKQLREKLSLTPQETKAIQEIVQEYSTSENPNKEELFNKIKEQFGEKVWKERIESIADVKRYLRTNKINVSDEVKKDITDYPQFRKKNANKINFSKDGLGIDTYYDELVSRFPDYFSYGVDEVYGDLTIPANQLRKIESVANLEIYETKTQDLDDATIQSAVDIITNGITGYKNDLTMRAAQDTAKEALDSIAPAKAEQLTNGTRGEALLNQSLDNHPIATVEDRIAEKQRAVDAEIADNKQLRREAEAGYNAEIERLSQEYLSKKDKNTKVANNIIRRIAKLEKLKASVDADYAKRISDLEARAEKVKSPTYSRAMHKQTKMQENAQWAENLLGDTSTWKDKKIGLQYSTNTERRNLRDIVRDENGNKDIAKADSIDDALNGQYNREEAAKKREIAEARKKYADLKITKAEDAYIQMLGELRHNPDTTLTEKVVKEYYEKHKNKIDTAKVDKVIEMARKDYDSWLNRVNKELKNQGMREIPYRQGYFPHFTEPKQNFIQKLFNWKTQDNEIPTSIAGLTETFKPVRTWQSFDKTRYSDTTDYSFLKGFDTYSEGVLDWIYHLDTLQKRRAVENYIRFTHSEEGIQKRIEEVYADEGIDANEAQARIEEILSTAKNPLNNFVQDFTTHTNILAGKKNSYDRGVEQTFNRHIYSIMTNVQNRVSANMVLANVRSALTNFIPITQSWAQVSPIRSLQAVKDTISNAIVDDGIIDKSTFLTNRLKEPDKLYKTNWDKILDKAGIMFEVVDNFSSQVIWRSKYNQNLADGMTETEAIKNADQFSENVMAGRSKGNEPTLFNAKNPITKAFTMFQLEVNNQYGYFFKDLPNDLKAESEHWKLNLAKGYTTAFIGAYAYNALFSALTGSDAALDPIGIIEDLLRDLGLFDDDEKEEPLEALGNFGKNVAEELPLVGGLMGGGRIPLSSALPYNDKGFVEGVDDFAEDASKTVKAAIDSIKNRDLSAGDWSGLKNSINEMSNPLLNVVLPVGGGQIKKAMQGLSMFNIDEEHPIAGSYTSNGNLRFPVDDTLANRVQAGIFGQWANENARDYIENGRKPLTPEQTQEYVDVDLPIADYWKYREGLKGLKTNAEKADYINSLNIKDWQKSLLMNNILDRKEDVDMSNYNNYNSYEEFDYAEKNPEKYKFFKANGISYEDYANADEDGKTAYTWAYNNPEKYKVSKVITDDVVQYRSYTSDLYDIKADKDENGNAISGTSKSKKIDYINSLDLDYEQKIVLYRMQFKTDDTYNAEIVNYVNSLDYLTYEERVDIFTELGYTVKDGRVYWD